ncbi:hypothetical protein GEMRC1_007520 [Eukaryota sp. GEM-RC1]
MLPHQWRKFSFFTKKENSNATAVSNYLQDVDVVCVATSKGYLFFGDSRGNIHVCDRSFEFTSFRAHEGAVCSIVTPEIPSRLFLITAGCSEDGTEWKVSIWSLRQNDPGGVPTLLRKLSVATSHNETSQPITLVSTNEDMTHLAVALANGSVILFQGDLLRDRKVHGRLLTSQDNPTTGMSFLRLVNEDGWGLYISTKTSVTFFRVTPTAITKNEVEPVSSKIGCATGCSTVLRESQEFAVGTEAVIWYYGVDGKHGASFFEGPKRLLTCFRQYLVILSPP